MRQRVLEGVLEVWKELGLVYELRGLQTRQATPEIVLRQLGDREQQRPGQILADHGRRLEQALVVRGQAIDARRQNRLDRGRHLDRAGILHQAVRAAVADQDLRLHERAHALLEK